MQTNKEHVRAHTFVSRRLVSAVVDGRPDGWEHPMGRSSGGVVIGLVVAVVLVLGALALGWIRPGSGPSLAAGTNVVVEKETGTRYVVEKGTLRPVTNLASALLATGPELKMQTLSRKRTATLPRGAPLGIVGAPDDVPPASGMTGSGWTACMAVLPGSTTTVPGTLLLSFGGTARPTPLGGGESVLVEGPDGDLYVATGSTRYEISVPYARNALGYAAVNPVVVPSAWLAALRPGRTIRPIDIDGAGQAGPAVAGLGTVVGQVLSVRTPQGTFQYFVVQRTAIAAVTELEAQLILGNPRLAPFNPGGTAHLVPEVAVAAAAPAGFPQTQGWPQRAPRPVEPRGHDLCVHAGAGGPAWVGLRSITPGPYPADPTVQVPPGSAVLVEAGEPGNTSTSAFALVDDLGRLFPVRSAPTLQALGLEAAPVLRVPSGLLAVIPEGPALDVAAVRGSSS